MALTSEAEASERKSVSIDDREAMKGTIKQATERRSQLIQKLGVLEQEALELISGIREIRSDNEKDEQRA